MNSRCNLLELLIFFEVKKSLERTSHLYYYRTRPGGQ